jgi:hypothetical protein
MIRLFFVEQIYRADQILQGKPYHNDWKNQEPSKKKQVK